MRKLFFTNKAVEDLSSIWEYSCEKWSEQQADLYYFELISSCNEISTNHLNYDREYTEIQSGIFARRCNKHFIFYHYVDDNDVEILRILHERMDIINNLS